MLFDQTVLLTGGAGFIGTALAARLLENNRVRILDNLRRNALVEAGLMAHPQLDLQVGDVRDYEVVRRAMVDVDRVVHLASIAGVDTVLRDPVTTMETSLEGTMHVLRAAKESRRIKRLIDFSTSEVFGTYAYRVREGDVTQLGAVGEARWTYAVSKLATEHLCHTYYKQFDLPTCAIRPFNIYGPGQVGEGAVHRFVTRALSNQTLEVHNDGSQIRAWCYIADIIEAIMLALTHERAPGETFNVGNPRSTLTIYHLAQLVRRLAGSSVDIAFTSWDAVDVELRVPDVSKAERLLGFRARTDLEEGLQRTLEWYRARYQRGDRTSAC